MPMSSLQVSSTILKSINWLCIRANESMKSNLTIRKVKLNKVNQPQTTLKDDRCAYCASCFFVTSIKPNHVLSHFVFSSCTWLSRGKYKHLLIHEV